VNRACKPTLNVGLTKERLPPECFTWPTVVVGSVVVVVVGRLVDTVGLPLVAGAASVRMCADVVVVGANVAANREAVPFLELGNCKNLLLPTSLVACSMLGNKAFGATPASK